VLGQDRARSPIDGGRPQRWECLSAESARVTPPPLVDGHRSEGSPKQRRRHPIHRGRRDQGVIDGMEEDPVTAEILRHVQTAPH
jgi:hypothetical protein